MSGRMPGLLIGCVLSGVMSPAVWAAGGQDCGACNAPAPTCQEQTTEGTDACGNECHRRLSNVCSAPAPACDQTTQGTWTCGGVCTRRGAPCSSVSSPPGPTWLPYGFAVPGDPVYGFPHVCDGAGNPVYADPNTRTLAGFAAKGNIIVGDYTSQPFQHAVLGKLNAITQPYAVDPTDEELGYHDAGFDSHGRPKFSGQYDQNDGFAGTGTKLDGSPRRFYESSLPDAQFQALVDSALTENNAAQAVAIDGVYFTNHAFAGLVNAGFFLIDGSMVSRDDGLIFGRELRITHDIRLFNPQSQQLSLPFTIKRPRLVHWEECPLQGCPAFPPAP